MPKLYLIIPIFNEAENLRTLLASVSDLSSQFNGNFQLIPILIDDGSTDKSADTAKKYKLNLALEILRHDVNQGPGAAFGTGFASLANRVTESDWVVTMEGDNTSRKELLKQMFTRAREGYEVVLASPYMYGGGISNTTSFRMFLSFIANFFVKEALGLRGLLTMSSFYRLYSGRTILKLQKTYGSRIVECRGFESMVELLMKLVFFRSSISEVPMLLDSSARIGKSKMKVLRTAIGYLLIWTKKARWISQVPASESFVPQGQAAVANQ